MKNQHSQIKKKKKCPCFPNHPQTIPLPTPNPWKTVFRTTSPPMPKMLGIAASQVLFCQRKCSQGHEAAWRIIEVTCLNVLQLPLREDFSSISPDYTLAVHYTSGISWPPRQRSQEASICIICKYHVHIRVSQEHCGSVENISILVSMVATRSRTKSALYTWLTIYTAVYK